MKNATDEEVIARLQAGDDAAYDELVARYKDRLFTFIRYMVKERTLAEDLLQETFIRLWKYRMKYREIARFSTWIYTIAGNLVRSEMRRKSRDLRVDIEPKEGEDRPAVELVDKAPPVDAQVHSRMTIERVRAAIDRLPEEFREVIILRELEELSYEEIVELISVPLGTVKSRINRARARLRELLTEESRGSRP